MYRYLIFDVDGTLIDTARAFIVSLQQLLRERFGWEKSEEELRFVFGIPSVDALARLGLRDDGTFIPAWEQRVGENRRLMKLYDGIQPVLDALKAQGWPMGVITSRTRPEVERDFPFFGLERYFPTVVTSSDTALHKPDPAPMRRMLELLQARPEECLYLGDTQYDCLCAQRAGVKFALAGWGAMDRSGYHPDYVLRQPAEYLTLLEREGKRP